MLYRSSAKDHVAHFPDGDRATAEVLLKAFVEIGMARTSPRQPVFVNHTLSLLERDPALVPPERCVIEVLENVPVNGSSIACLERLTRSGYRIALDDFVYSREYVPFLRLARYVKLDVRALSAAALRAHVEVLGEFRLTIIAEKVETEAEFLHCREIGCHLFQGNYLRKPEVLRGRRIPANRLSSLSLLAEFSRPEPSAAALAVLISRDAAQTYSLLRLTNSALYGGAVPMRSPIEAVKRLGMDNLFRWISLLVLSGYDDCPAGYLGFALERARACELAAAGTGTPAQLAYMAGLLSTLDAILNAPLEDILGPLPLDDRFKSAILLRQGEVGAILDAVVDYQAGRFEAAAGHGIPIARLQAAFWEGVQYSATMLAGWQLVQGDG